MAEKEKMTGKQKALGIGAAVAVTGFLGVKGFGMWTDHDIRQMWEPDPQATPKPTQVVKYDEAGISGALQRNNGFSERTANSVAQRMTTVSDEWNSGDQQRVKATEVINGTPTTVFAHVSSGPHWWPHKWLFSPPAGSIDAMCVQTNGPEGPRITMTYNGSEAGLVPNTQVARLNLKRGEDQTGVQRAFYEGSCENWFSGRPTPTQTLDVSPAPVAPAAVERPTAQTPRTGAPKIG